MIAAFFDFLKSLKGWRFVNLLAVLFFALVFYFLHYYQELIHEEIEYQRRPQEIRHRIEPDLMINQSLNEMRKKCMADRALILRFHNGQNYFDGSHKIRFSCEYEKVGAGVMPVSLEMQNLPASLFSWYINEVMQDNFRYFDVNEIPDINTRVGLQAQGVASVVCIPYMVDSQLVAIVCLSWVGDRANMSQILENLDMEVWESEKLYGMFKEDAIKIGNLLYYEDIENKKNREESETNYRRIFIGR